MVVPSRQEAFGQTASEAHACGTPVVAFKGTGLEDVVVDGETGFFVSPYNTEEMATKINDILTIDNLKTRMGKNA